MGGNGVRRSIGGLREMCRSLVEVDKWSESEEVTGQVDKQEA